MDKRKLRELVSATVLLTFAVGLAFAPDAYLPMLLRAFLLPSTVLFGLLGIIALVARRWWVAQAALAGVAIVAAQFNTPYAAARSTEADVDLRVFHMNVLQPNVAHQHAIHQALASNADLISAQEVSPQWAIALQEGLCAHYPYARIEARTNCYGIALFSRIPFDAVRSYELHGTPLIEADITVGEHAVRLVSVHATSPIGPSHFRRRNDQLAALAKQLGTHDSATIVIGDLNTVPWDRAYRRFCAQSGLLSTTTTQRTWPSIGPLAIIPLDHVLISSGLTANAIRTIHVPRSDHKAILAELNLTTHAQ